MPSRICPECGHDLVFKHGAYGSFIGCSNYPVCKYTMNEDGTPTRFIKEVDEWDEDGKPTSYGYSIQTKVKSPCKRCKGTGLIPFKGRHDAFLHCSCHPVYGDNPVERYIDIRPDDFDFPLSDTFRGYAYEYCNQPDPGYVPQETVLTPIEDRLDDLEAEASSHGGVPRKYTEKLEQLQGKMMFLQSKVDEIRAKRSKRYEEYEDA